MAKPPYRPHKDKPKKAATAKGAPAGEKASAKKPVKGKAGGAKPGTAHEQPRRGLVKPLAEVQGDGDPKAARAKSVRVKTAKGRTVSSKLWLERQLNDPYVRMAKELGYRSRAAFKLKELDERFGLIKQGARVADLGAAPGGWTQVALERGAAHVVGVDIQEIEPIPGAVLLVLDMLDPDAPSIVKQALGGPADVVLSDMAPFTTGHRVTDHDRIVAMVEAAAAFACEVLKPGGAFVAKVFQGGAQSELLAILKQRFEKVRHAKPPSSRKESPETFLIAQGFKG